MFLSSFQLSVMRYFSEVVRKLTPNPGVSIPAVTTRFDKTKQDIRKGRKTGSPLSSNMSLAFGTFGDSHVPGCNVESTIFFAFHNSGVISRIFPCL